MMKIAAAFMLSAMVLMQPMAASAVTWNETVSGLGADSSYSSWKDEEEGTTRYQMEALRDEDAIGGVYGSPYWLRQLYLGYHSLNLRLYCEGEQKLFKEDLSWMADGTTGKRLTLWVNLDNPQNLTMRLDGEVIEVLERSEFEVITLQNKYRKTIMEYNVADLKAAREIYGLARSDQLCVGGEDDPVMKIDEDGWMTSIDQGAAK